jgi:hypothetical protein
MLSVGVVRCVTICLVGTLCLDTTGCVMVVYRERLARPTTENIQPLPPAVSPYMASARVDPSQPNTLIIHLSEKQCPAWYVTSVTDTTYSRPSPRVAWSLVSAGALMAGLGAYFWFSAHGDPSQCVMGDNSCITPVQAKEYAGALWGLGALSAIAGAVELLQRPSVIGQPRITYERIQANPPFADCRNSRSIANVPVQVDYGAAQPEIQTNEFGDASFNMDAVPGYATNATVYAMDGNSGRQYAIATVSLDRFRHSLPPLAHEQDRAGDGSGSARSEPPEPDKPDEGGPVQGSSFDRILQWLRGHPKSCRFGFDVINGVVNQRTDASLQDLKNSGELWDQIQLAIIQTTRKMGEDRAVNYLCGAAN